MVQLFCGSFIVDMTSKLLCPCCLLNVCACFPQVAGVPEGGWEEASGGAAGATAVRGRSGLVPRGSSSGEPRGRGADPVPLPQHHGPHEVPHQSTQRVSVADNISHFLKTVVRFQRDILYCIPSCVHPVKMHLSVLELCTKNTSREVA